MATPTNTIQPMSNTPASAKKGQSNMKIEENVDVAGIKTRQIVETFFFFFDGVEPAWGRHGE